MTEQAVELSSDVCRPAQTVDNSRVGQPTSIFTRVNHLMRGVMFCGALIPLGVFAFALLARFSFFGELFLNFRFHICLMLTGSGLLFWVLGRRTMLWVTAAAVAWCLWGIVSIYIPATQPVAGPQTFTVMSFNVLGSNRGKDTAVNQILEVDPDVLVIIEYSRNWHSTLNCLNESHPHQVRIPRWHGFGIAIFSRFPLSETEVLQLTESETDNPSIVTQIEVGDQKIRLAAVHVLSPTNRYRMRIRNQQFAEFAAELVEDDLPTIALGDFNCVPWSPFLRDFQRTTGYRDSRQGFGTQSTFPADKWLFQIPIDHAFVSRDIHVHDRRVGYPSFSDHLPIVLEVSTARQ